jgi:uncharacterized protein YceK
MQKIIIVLAVCMLSIVLLFSGCVSVPKEATPGPDETTLPGVTPSLVITVDSDANKLFVTGTDMNVKWSDIVITTDNSEVAWRVHSGGGLPLDGWKSTVTSTADVTAGDYIQLQFNITTNPTGVRVSLRYVPTNSLLGMWSVDV